MGERIAHGMPLFGSLYFGAVGLALALGGARRRARWALLGLAGLALAWLGGEAPERVVGWTGGLFRYPEKLLLWSVLAAALLAGWRVADAFRAPEGARASRLPWTLAATCLLGLGLLVVAGPMLSEALAAKSGPEGARSAIRMLDASLFRWELALGIGALSLALLPLALARRSGGAVVALQLVGLLQLAPLVPTMPTAPLREPGGFTAETPPGDGVLNAALTFPPLRPLPAYRLEGESAAAIREVQARELSPAAGVPRGLVYPLAPDLEGLCTPAYKELQRTLPGLSEAERIAWFRRTGVDRLVLFRVPEAEGLEWLGSAESLGAPSYLFGVESPVPAAYRPARVVRVESEAEARRRAGAEPDPTAVAFVAGAEASAGPGPVAPVAWQADRLVVDVGERPGLVVLRRTFHPLYRARCEATPARTLPVDSLLLGVEVPAGCGRLTVDVSSLPEWLATIVAAPLALVALFVSRRGRRARAPLRSRRPRPAGTSRSAG